MYSISILSQSTYIPSILIHVCKYKWFLSIKHDEMARFMVVVVLGVQPYIPSLVDFTLVAPTMDLS